MIPDAAVSYFDKRCLSQKFGGSINCRESMGHESEETTLEYRIIVPPPPLINFSKIFQPPRSYSNPPFINFWKNEMVVNKFLNKRKKKSQ